MLNRLEMVPTEQPKSDADSNISTLEKSRQASAVQAEGRTRSPRHGQHRGQARANAPGQWYASEEIARMQQRS